MHETSGEKKIYIDEDWKSRVEAEREELAKQKDASDQAASEPSAAAGATMPPASFEMLITTFATEAMVAMGQIPHPTTGKPVLHLEQARYFIDTLALLETKTRGNLSPQEAEMLTSMLHQLRLAFVTAQDAATGPTPGTAAP